MGNLVPCLKKQKSESLLLERQCPYCKFILPSSHDKNNHIKTCIYNKEVKLFAIPESSIYSDSGF